MRMLYKTYL